MHFLEQVGLSFVLLWAAFAIFLRGRSALIGTTVGVVILLCSKQLPMWAALAAGTVLCGGILLEIPVRAWARKRDPGALLHGIIGMAVLILFYGIFLGPVASVLVWLLTAGLQILPSFNSRTGWLPYWANTLLRGMLSVSMLLLGLYGVYA